LAQAEATRRRNYNLGMNFTTAAELDSIVRPAVVTVDGLTVRSPEPKLDDSIAAAVATIRGWRDTPAMTDLVRTMYKRVGIDPTKTRPSSEALLRRIRKGDSFPRINGVVDVINWTSVETQLSFGVYDLDKIHGDVTLRLGRDGEEYAGIRKDIVHVAGRLALVDEAGPFGNPTSDSARTMVTTAAARVLVVVFAPAGAAKAGDNAAELARARLRDFLA
jgi:DNA/RNA-binding domain of Phe-tRNA-synthetase-like protein